LTLPTASEGAVAVAEEAVDTVGVFVPAVVLVGLAGVLVPAVVLVGMAVGLVPAGEEPATGDRAE
jgi:hypothetical protein